MNSKKRYEINKGKKNFDVRVINPKEYIDEIFDITVAAYSSWPSKYRPVLNEMIFKKRIELWSRKVVVAAFNKENGCICGYAYLTEYDDYAGFNVLRVRPECEKQAINAAIVNGILEHYADKLTSGFYILDGERSINHETAFQDYLEKYFEFRKAYCSLHIEYRSQFKWVIKLLYLLRGFWRRMDNIGVIHQLNSLLSMEEIVRN